MPARGIQPTAHARRHRLVHLARPIGMSASKAALLALAMAAVLLAVAYALLERGTEPAVEATPVVAEPASSVDPPTASAARGREIAVKPKSEGGNALQPGDDLVAQLQVENAQLREEIRRLVAQLQTDHAKLGEELKLRTSVTERLAAGHTDAEADALVRKHLERILDSPDSGVADWSLECRGSVCKVDVTALESSGRIAHQLLQKDAELSQLTRGFAVRPGHEGGPLTEEMYLLLRTRDAGP